MNIVNNKMIQYLFIASIVFNLLFLIYGIRLIYIKFQTYKSEQILQLNNNNKLQSKPITYFIGRNELFTKLPNDTNEIIMLGNSLTHNFEWSEYFNNVNIKNRGINGDITKGILNRLDEITESKPKKIFIEIGINDLLQGYFVNTIFKNYCKIVQTIRERSPKTRIYVQNILPTNLTLFDNPVIDSICVLNNKLKDYSALNNLKYIDLYTKFMINERLNPKYDCGDNLHLNGAGYLVWCAMIQNYIYE